MRKDLTRVSKTELAKQVETQREALVTLALECSYLREERDAARQACIELGLQSRLWQRLVSTGRGGFALGISQEFDDGAP